jgi:hypothetical protein
VKGARLPVEGQLDPGLRRAGADVIGQGQRTTPLGRRHRAAERLQERQRVAVRDGQDGDLQDGRRIGLREFLRARLRGPARAERIAGVHRHVHHAATLHTLLRPVGTTRIHISLEVPIVSRVRVDETADRAALPRHLRLDAAPARAVARQHDLALHADAHLVEADVVGGHAVVHVHHLARDVAVGRVGVERGRVVGVARVGVLGDGHFLDDHGCARRRHHLHHALGGPGHQRLEALDARIESPRLELGQRIVGHLARARAPGHVGLACHHRHVLLQLRAVGHLAELLFALALGRHGVARKAADGAGLRPGTRRETQGDGEGNEQGAGDTRHRSLL